MTIGTTRWPTHSGKMQQYYFDIRDGEDFARDEMGVALADVNAAMDEAKSSLADIVRETLRDGSNSGKLSIEVRTDCEPVAIAELSFETRIIPLAI